MRRHITKGFYDEAPAGSGAGDSTIVNIVTNWTTPSDKWFNVYSKTLTTADVTESLADGAFDGQILCLNLVSNGGSYKWTLNNGKITSGSTDYTTIVLEDNWDNITMIALTVVTTRRWYPWANNGCVLS